MRQQLIPVAESYTDLDSPEIHSFVDATHEVVLRAGAVLLGPELGSTPLHPRYQVPEDFTVEMIYNPEPNETKVEVEEPLYRQTVGYYAPEHSHGVPVQATLHARQYALGCEVIPLRDRSAPRDVAVTIGRIAKIEVLARVGDDIVGAYMSDRGGWFYKILRQGAHPTLKARSFHVKPHQPTDQDLTALALLSNDFMGALEWLGVAMPFEPAQEKRG